MPLKAANIIVDDLKQRATKSNGRYYLYGKPIQFDFDVWVRRLQTTFENCDEFALYANNPSLQETCYLNVAEGYDSWVKAAHDPNISTRTWFASFASGTYGNTVDFHHWVSMLRVYGARNGDGVKKPTMPDSVKEEIAAYRQELSVVNSDIEKERNRVVYSDKKKLNMLYIRQSELRDKIGVIANKYDSE